MHAKALPCAVAILSTLLSAVPCPADGNEASKVQILKLESKQKTEGSYLTFEGTSQYPDGVVLGCEVRYFGRIVPGAMLFAKVRKGRFSANVGPVPKPFLVGAYQAVVRFVSEDQTPDLMYDLQYDSDASYSSELQVGTKEDVEEFEKRYKTVLQGVLDSAERRVKDLASAYAEAEAGKRWHGTEGPDIDACVAFTRENEQGYRHDLETLAPFLEGAGAYQPDLTDLMTTFVDALHLITITRVRGLFHEWGVSVPDDWNQVGLDTPIEVLEKQMLGEALQPVRDYLHPPPRKEDHK